MRKQSKIVYVALSGGVDSATTAALLQERGFLVHGVYMRTWSPDDIDCPQRDDRKDALRVCAHLGIPFKTWDFTAEYKERVVDYMIKEYKAGRTPNPDVMCNREIKFGLFLNCALKEGADLVATGHHARIQQAGDKEYKLLKGLDPNKDQTYFLWTLGQEQLSRTLMPIGEFADKDEVRKYAAEKGLPVADKKDSQGVCFVGPIDVQAFLRRHITAPAGPVVTVTGRKVGQHDGLPFYTIGQRRGIGVGGTGPYYVAEKDERTNTLVVAPPAHEQALMSRELTATDVRWINESPQDKTEITASTRYRQKPIPATLNLHSASLAKDGGSRREIINLQFKESVRAITPGQSVVFYNGEEVIGGGIISS